MPERIARVEQDYAGRRIKVGQRFHVEPQDVELLSRLGRIEVEDGERGYFTRDLIASGRRRRKSLPQ